MNRVEDAFVYSSYPEVKRGTSVISPGFCQRFSMSLCQFPLPGVLLDINVAYTPS